MPKVSVVMSVYNDARYLPQAIESILAQTAENFEFIIINDGSTDESQTIINSYNDNRIILLSNDKNLGLIRSLNRGLAVVRGKYVARLDANDIARLDRLEHQVYYLDTHPNVGLISSWYMIVDESGQSQRIVALPSTSREIASQMLYRNCICHTGAMFRQVCINQVSGYREHWEQAYGCTGAEDWDLWLRILDHHDLANIPEPLVHVRVIESGLSIAKRITQRKVIRLVLQEALQRRQAGAGPTLSSRDLARHHLFVALEYLAEDDPSGSEQEMKSAMAADPDFALDRDHITKTVAERALEVSQFADGPLAVQTGIVFMHRFFDNLPPAAAALVPLKRESLSLYHVASAFRFHQLGHKRASFSNVIRGIARDPHWLGNRGVLSILCRSLVPGWL